MPASLLKELHYQCVCESFKFVLEPRLGVGMEDKPVWEFMHMLNLENRKCLQLPSGTVAGVKTIEDLKDDDKKYVFVVKYLRIGASYISCLIIRE